MTKTMSPEDHLRARIESQRLEIERLRGLKPELPPRAPDGEGLPRYGLRWNGPHEPVTVPMDDGFWTPWHLAAKAPAHEPGDVTRLPVPGTKLTRLSDIADELIRELHKQGMEKMQAVFDGTRLRIDPWPEPASRESPSATIVTAEEASHPASFRHWRKDEQVPYDGCHCRTCVPARASVKPSPADLVGALQDVVHTDPGPVRAGHASREASSLPEHVHSWDGDQCHYCHIPRSAVIDDASNLCPATSPPVPHQAAQPGMRFDIKPGTCIYCGITLKSGEQHGGG